MHPFIPSWERPAAVLGPLNNSMNSDRLTDNRRNDLFFDIKQTDTNDLFFDILTNVIPWFIDLFILNLIIHDLAIF